ncbi:hypothetical protein [Halocola ammonii]
MSINSDIIRRFLLTLVYYCTVFTVGYFVLVQLKLVEEFSISNLIYFDAENYQKIAQTGYTETWLTAYFPLFPLFWSVVSGAVNISILNGLLYILFLSLLSWKLNISSRVQLLYLALPSVIFFFLPYSEALFFASSVLLLIGLRNRWFWLIAVGTFLAATCRPTIAVFIPAFWLVSLLEFVRIKTQFDWKTPMAGTLASLLGLAFVFYIQWLDTRKFFTFLEAQKLWGNQIGFPEFPFSSWGGNNIVKLDAIAFWTGTCSGMMFILAFFRKKLHLRREEIFSLLYLAGTTMLILIYRGGEFFSLNRFIFATPFFLVVLGWLSKIERIRRWWWVPVSLLVTSLLFGSFVHIQALLKWLLLVVLMTALILSIPGQQFRRLPRASLKTGILMLLVLTQVYFLWRFLVGDWIA